METSTTRSRRLVYSRMFQNFHLIWLDGNIDEKNDDDCRNSILNLRKIINTVHTFTDMNECVDFIDERKEEKMFMICSGALGQTIVPAIHNKSQINTIYIFCGNKERHEKWAKQWAKIKGVFTNITDIYEALKQAVHNADENSISFSFVRKTTDGSSQNLDTLDPIFMYTQILKEILLTIDFEQSHINDFVKYCRKELAGNEKEIRNVDTIAKEYRRHEPIWWYTCQIFLFPMVNKALRLMEVDRIIKMGFFIRDLHNNIAELHAEQYSGQNSSGTFVLYRGQGLSKEHFDQLKTTPGGLIAFNNFLSTSKSRQVSLEFVEEAVSNQDLVGILFVMKIDPSIHGTPFADITKNSFFGTIEEEILFSMHSVFRIGQIKQADGCKEIWEVNLTLTSDDDPQLRQVTKAIQDETKGLTGWHRLGKLMMRLNEFEKAEEFYQQLLKQSNDENGKARLLYHIGCTKSGQEKYAEAIEYYEEALKIEQKTLPIDHPDLASSYSNIGSAYSSLEKYTRALSCYEKALEIYKKTPDSNQHDLATTYNNIGFVYNNMKEYSKAYSFYEKAIKISKATLPAYHPSLGSCYHNMGAVCYNMDEYSDALSHFQRALDILQRSLPPNDPSIRTVKDSIEIIKKRL